MKQKTIHSIVALTLCLSPMYAYSADPATLDDLRKIYDKSLSKAKQGAFFFANTTNDQKPVFIAAEFKSTVSTEGTTKISNYLSFAKKEKGVNLQHTDLLLSNLTPESILLSGFYTNTKGDWKLTTCEESRKGQEAQLEETLKTYIAASDKKVKSTDIQFYESQTSDGKLQQCDWRQPWEAPLPDQQQFSVDAMMWTNVIHPTVELDKGLPAGSEHISPIMARIFALVATAGLKFKQENGSEIEFPYNTASLLSHGGRILIGVKKDANLDTHAVFNWIVNNDAKGNKPKEIKNIFEKRAASTHDIEFTDDSIKELKIKGIKPSGQNWGMDVPVGGFGSLDSRGLPVLANGQHGHLFMFSTEAAKKSKSPYESGYLIGVETSAPGHSFHYGTPHNVWAQSAEVSPTGGQKWKEWKSVNGPKELGALVITIANNSQLEEAANLSEEMLRDRTRTQEILSTKPRF